MLRESARPYATGAALRQREIAPRDNGHRDGPDPFAQIETISPRPMLFTAGEKAHSIEFSESAYKRAAKPKELVIVPGVTR